MDMRKFTEKSLACLQSASALANEYGNQEITQAHALFALLKDEDGLIFNLLAKMYKSATEIREAALSAVKKLPKVRGGEPFLGKNSRPTL